MRLDHYFRNYIVNANDEILVNDIDRYIVIQDAEGLRTIVCINKYMPVKKWCTFNDVDEINILYFDSAAKVVNISREYNFNKCLLTGAIIRKIVDGKLYVISRESFSYTWSVIALHNGEHIKSITYAHMFIDYVSLKSLLKDLTMYELMDVIPFGD